MFDLSWSHIGLFVVIALLVLGPKELPNAIRTGAQLLRAGRKLAGEFRGGLDELMREAELDETRRSIKQAMTEGLDKTIGETCRSRRRDQIVPGESGCRNGDVPAELIRPTEPRLAEYGDQRSAAGPAEFDRAAGRGGCKRRRPAALPSSAPAPSESAGPSALPEAAREQNQKT